MRHISSAAEIPLTIINAGLSAAAAKATAAQAAPISAFIPHMLVSYTVMWPTSLADPAFWLTVGPPCSR